MGHKHSREQILDAAARVAAATGLSGLSFRLVAEEVGTSDRVVVYYFPDKDQLIAAIFGRAGEQLQRMLSASLQGSSSGALTRVDILRAARTVFTDPANEWVARLFLEAVGLAAIGKEPFATLAPLVLQAWVAWLEPQLGAASTGAAPSGAASGNATPGDATSIVAIIDGLLIVRLLLGAEAGDAAWDSAIDAAQSDRLEL